MSKKTVHIHRHFLAIPFALIIAIAPAVHGVLNATLLEDVQSTSSVSQYKGVEYIPIDSAKVITTDSLRLYNGSVLIASEGYGTLQATNTYKVSLFNAAAHISLYGDTVSVAALTGPVLVQDQDRHLIVPKGRQWRSSTPIPSLDAGVDLWLTGITTKPVPTRFLYKQLKNIESFALSDNSLPEPRSQKPIAVLPESLQLPAAQKYQEEVFIAQARYAIEHNDADALHAILADASTLSKETLRQLSVLIARSVDRSALAIPLMPIVGAQQDVWILMSMHPQFSSLAWTYGQPVIDTHHKITALFSLPITDVMPKAFGELAVLQWGKMLEQSAIDAKNPSLLLNALIVHTKNALVHMEQSLYPERSRWYIQQVVDVASPYVDNLSVHAQKSLYVLKHWEDISLTAPRAAQKELQKQNIVHAQVSAQPLVSDQLPPEEVETRAYGLLEDRHAVFTVETEVSAIAPNTARISNIVFSSVERDRVFTFLLNVEHQTVSKLTEEGREYPFTLPLNRFVSWAMR